MLKEVQGGGDVAVEIMLQGRQYRRSRATRVSIPLRGWGTNPASS
jgi:hypothetical protein